jgi:arylsulfatase A-like enzyme
MFSEVDAPRPPSVNESDVSDKPAYVRNHKLMGARGMNNLDGAYQKALRSLERVDEFVGTAAEILRAQGEWENTYVIFYTDNGIHTGYHRLGYGKGSPYKEDIVFPMAVRGPGVTAGSSAEVLIGNHDIAPTLADLAGAETPDSVDGRSFAPILYGSSEATEAWREVVLSQGKAKKVPRWYGVLTTRYSYVEYENGERELYDLEADPYQLENLTGTLPEFEAQLSARLEALRGCAGDSCREAEDAP